MTPIQQGVDAETDMKEFEEITPPHNVSIQMDAVQFVEVNTQTLLEDELLAESAPALFRSKALLLELDDEIRSRKRTLELLNARLPEISAEVKEQLLVRDVRLEVLYHEVVTLRAMVRMKNEALLSSPLRAALKKCEEELSEVKAAKLASERRLQCEQEKFAERTEQLEQEQEATTLLNETLSEEVEGLRALSEAEEQQCKETKQDVVKLSEIVHSMTEVNSDLNSKVEGLNAELATLALKYHEAAVTAEHVEELEQQLADAVNDATANKRRGDQSEMLVEGLRAVYKEMEMGSREVCSKLEDLTNSFVGMGASLVGNDAANAQRVKSFAVSLNELRSRLQSKLPEEGKSDGKVMEVEELSSKVAELTSELSTKEGLVLKLTRDTQDFQKRLDAIAETHARALKGWTESAKESKARLDSLEQKLDQFVIQLSAQRDELSQLKETQARTNTELDNKSNRLDDARHKLGEAREQRSDLEKRLISLSGEYSTAQEAFNAKQHDLKTAELRAQRVLIGFGVMEDEVFRRENEYLSRERLIMHQQSQLEAAIAKYASLQASVKALVAKEMQKANALIEEKERETDILKEMVRSSHVEVKVRDNTILKYKVKFKEQPPAGLMPRNKSSFGYSP
jgi:DNA repair exonuclease SbcCD ATPase subunit